MMEPSISSFLTFWDGVIVGAFVGALVSHLVVSFLLRRTRRR